MSDLASSRAVIVLGMHRSGTSATTRGLASLGVCLGDNLMEANCDNPKGYWENNYIYSFNERLLKSLNLTWDDPTFINKEDFDKPELEPFKDEAISYLSGSLAKNSLWGFKDPRTIRLLPFWKNVLDRLSLKDTRYLIVIRNPVNVCNSLCIRNGTDPQKAYQLYLVHNVPFLHEISNSPFTVVDYDLLLEDPYYELFRISKNLEIPFKDKTAIDEYTCTFLDINLRHNFSQVDSNNVDNTLALESYLWLRELARDRLRNDSPLFWSTWQKIQSSLKGNKINRN